jgi:carbon-monoxide dehydrogenase medium subunit
MHQPSPGLPEFSYIRPASYIEASRFLAEHLDEARPFLGGTDTFVRMRDGIWKDKYLLDLKGLPGIADLVFDADEGLTVGAAVSMNHLIASADVVAHYPLLAEASRTVASYQLRSRATIAGNVCNASPAGDTIGACLVYGGIAVVNGLNGVRLEPLNSFFIGPGQTILGPADIVSAIRFPIPPTRHAGRYIKLGRNAVGDLAIVGVTVLGYPDDEAVSGYQFKVVLASVAPVPLVAAEAEEILANQTITSQTIDAAAQAAQAAAKPIDDTRGSARYRKLMVRNLVRRAVTEVWQQMERLNYDQ